MGNAVTRNRARRRLRALFADSASSLRPGWYVVGASPAVATCSAARLRAEVDTVVRKLDEVIPR